MEHARRTTTRRTGGAGLAAACLVGLGCGEDPPALEPGPSDAEVIDVPSEPRSLDASVACVERIAGERLAAVSPEGDAWLAGAFDEARGTSAWRVVRLGKAGLASEARELPVGPDAQAVAWGAASAAIVAGDAIQRFDASGRVMVDAPSAFRTPASLCGDPNADGIVVSEGRIARRDDAAWRTFRPEFEGLSRPMTLLAIDGACAAQDGRAWVLDDEGGLFALTATRYERVAKYEAIASAAASSTHVAIAAAGDAWVRDAEGAWSRLRFGNSPVTAVAASAGWTWMATRDRVIGFDGADFAGFVPRVGEAIETVAAHEGGVWTLGSASLCHAARRAPLRIEGVRPFERLRDASREVCLDDPTATLALDGEFVDVTTSSDEDEGTIARCASIELASLGWHELTVARDTERRTIAVERVPDRPVSFAADVQPRYEANCAGSACHGSASSNVPDLGTHAAWVEHADAIRARVVEDQTMPPASVTGWTEDDVAWIERWLDGGMLP